MAVPLRFFRFSALLLLGFSLPLAAEPIRVSGRILASAEQGLAGARVELLPAYEGYAETVQRLGKPEEATPLAVARTDAEGFFALDAPESGCFRVRVQANGYAPEEHPLLPLVEDADLPATLLGHAERREVRAVDRDGRPLPGIRFRGSVDDSTGFMPPPSVQTWRLSGNPGLTGADGKGILPWTSQLGPPRVLVISPLLLGQSATSPRDGGPITLRLSPGRAFRIEVRGEDGTPVPGAVVRWRDEPLGLTGPDGRLEIALLEYSSALTVETREGWKARVAVPPSGLPSANAAPPLVTVKPLPPRILTGRVVEAGTGAPLANALVWSGGDRLSAPPVHTGPDGGFRIAVPALGVTSLWAAAAGHGPESRSVPLDSSAPTLLKLKPAARLSGVVVDAAGRPVAGADLSLGDMGFSRNGFAWSRSDGRFQISGLPFRASGEISAHRSGFAPASVPTQTPAPGQPSPPLRIVLGQGLTLSGRTVDERGQPVAGAEVILGGGMDLMLEQGRATSDDSGRFELRRLSPGTFQLVVTHPGFATLHMSRIEAGADRPVLDLGEIVLRTGAVIEGRVTDDHGRPIEGAEVVAASALPAFLLDPATGEPVTSAPRARTGPGGTFRLTDLEPGKRTDLIVEHPGYVQARVPGVEVPTAEPLRIELKVSRGLAGRVIGPEGEPVADASLTWVQETRTEGGSSLQANPLGTTDGDGRFRAAGLTPGPIDLEVSALGYETRRVQGLQIPPDRDLEGMEIRLARGALLAVRVLSPEGEPVPGARVRADPLSPGRLPTLGARLRMSSSDSGRTDEEGACLVELAGPGSYSVRVYTEGRVMSVPVEAGPGKTPVEVRLARGATVSGRVTDRDGKGVPWVSIQLHGRQDGGFSANAGSLADGSFTLADVPPGVYQLSAFPRGYKAATLADVEVGTGAIEGLELRLEKKEEGTAIIQGRLLGLDPEEIPRANIQAVSAEHGQAQGKVGRDGSYRIQELAPGPWRVTAWAPSNRSQQVEVQIETARSVVDLDIDFGGAAPVSGRVTVDGAPLSDAEINFFQRGTFAGQGRTAYDGSFKVRLPGPGSYEVSVLAPFGTIGYAQTLNVPEGDRPVAIDVPTGALSGRILSAGAPVPDAVIEVQGILGGFSQSFFAPNLRSDGAGGFEVPRLAAGSYTLKVTQEGFAPATAQVSIRPGAAAAVAIELKPLP